MSVRTLAALLVLACGDADRGRPAAADAGARSDPVQRAESPSRGTAGTAETTRPLGDAPAQRGTPDSSTDADAALEDAARQVIGFLRGEADFGALVLADTVWFRLAPEGGGGRTPVPRERLRERAQWQARSASGAVYALVPPPSAEVLTTRVGRHFNCFEYPLAPRAPELAALPHVGTKLAPRAATSCLATWNLTLVFEPGSTPPRLVAAVYDQWEW